MKSIVAYYYMWKTTDRYQLQKRHRMMEKQNDLKEVIVHLRTSTGAPAGPRDLSGMRSGASNILIPISHNFLSHSRQSCYCWTFSKGPGEQRGDTCSHGN